jgi:hypothetical protein
MGQIAYITSDSKEVRLAYLKFERKTGTWDLKFYMDESFPGGISKIYKGRQIQTLSWNPGGLELLVIDIHGRLSLYSTYIAINRMPPAKSWPPDGENSMGAVVGSIWLNPKKSVR